MCYHNECTSFSHVGKDGKKTMYPNLLGYLVGIYGTDPPHIPKTDWPKS